MGFVRLPDVRGRWPKRPCHRNHCERARRQLGQSDEQRRRGIAEAIWNGLRPGSYELRVRSAQVEPLLAISGFEISPDGVAIAAPKEAIDVRSVLRSLELEFISPDGPVSVSSAFTRRSGSDSGWVQQLQTNGKIACVDPLDVVAVVDGYERIDLRAVRGKVRVDLWPVAKVSLVALEVPPALANRRSARVRITSVAPSLTPAAVQYKNTFTQLTMGPGNPEQLSDSSSCRSTVRRGRRVADRWVAVARETGGARQLPRYSRKRFPPVRRQRGGA